MSFPRVEQVKKEFPEILHAVLFLNTGLVVETTFSQKNVNIPLLGKKFMELIDKIRDLLKISGFEVNKYQKLLFEIEDFVIIILKLEKGENLALFFKGEHFFSKYGPVFQKSLDRLETLMTPKKNA